jgi:RimJ/RimL family protein N-acetyltransferase
MERSSETARVVLAPLAAAHAEVLFPLLNDWEVVRMLAVVPWPLTRTDVEDYASRAESPHAGSVDFVILAGGAPVGVCGVKKPGTGEPPRRMPRLGYWIGRPHWGRGYATEAVAALVDYALSNVDSDMVGAGIYEDNPASRRVLEKLGFAEAGRYQTHSRSRNGLVPTIDMHLLRATWAKTSSASR